MPSKHPVRTAIFIIIGCIVLVVLLFASPIIWYDIKTHYWEHEIKTHQKSEELRAWAMNLIATYGSPEYTNTIPGLVTNKPPVGIPISGRNPRVLLQREPLSETSYGPYHITLAWEAGTFLPMWGMDIGDSNFVTSHKNPEMWVPGIYFFVEPP